MVVDVKVDVVEVIMLFNVHSVIGVGSPTGKTGIFTFPPKFSEVFVPIQSFLGEDTMIVRVYG